MKHIRALHKPESLSRQPQQNDKEQPWGMPRKPSFSPERRHSFNEHEAIHRPSPTPGSAIDAPTPLEEETGRPHPPRCTGDLRAWRPACNAGAPSPAKSRQRREASLAAPQQTHATVLFMLMCSRRVCYLCRIGQQHDLGDGGWR